MPLTCAYTLNVPVCVVCTVDLHPPVRTHLRTHAHAHVGLKKTGTNDTTVFLGRLAPETQQKRCVAFGFQKRHTFFLVGMENGHNRRSEAVFAAVPVFCGKSDTSPVQAALGLILGVACDLGYLLVVLAAAIQNFVAQGFVGCGAKNTLALIITVELPVGSVLVVDPGLSAYQV